MRYAPRAITLIFVPTLLLFSARPQTVLGAPRGAKGAQLSIQQQADRGMKLFREKKYKEAIPLFDDSYQQTKNPTTLFNLGDAYGRLNQYREACDALERFMKAAAPQDENRPRAETRLATCRGALQAEAAEQFLKQNQPGKAAADFAAAYQADPVPIYLFNRCEAARAAGDKTEAVTACDDFLKTSAPPAQKAPAEVLAAELHGQLEAERAARSYERRDYEQAVTAWQDAYRYQPLAEYRLHLGQAQARAGHPAEARRTYEQILQDDPTPALRKDVEAGLIEARAFIEDERAGKLMLRGQHLQAADAWQEAYRIKPLPLFLFRQARARRLAGQRDAALDEFERFLKQPDAPATGLVQDSQLEVTELRDVLGAQRVALESRKPAYKKAWFWAAVAGAAAAAGAGVAAAIAITSRDNRDLSSSLGYSTVTLGQAGH